jgi:hypothetical protein
LGVVGVVPPSVQKSDLNDAEFVGGVGCEFGDDCVDGVLYRGKLDGLIGSVVVIINSLKPSDIIMRVCDDMHGEVVSIGTLLGVVFPHHRAIGKSDVLFLTG